MLNIKKGNLITAPDQVIGHCCNCFCVMGAGVAKAIATAFPEAFKVDKLTIKGDKKKLGTFTNSSGKKHVYNLYGQYNYGIINNKKPINYAALNSALFLMATDLKLKNYKGSIGFPMLGCGLAGGDWNKVKPMIEYHFKDFLVNIYYF